MREQLRDLLSPHFGHLDFLMKIHREEISYDNMKLLVELIRDKNLVSNLHKDLHSYRSYYMLMVELHFVKENLKYIKFFKENLTKEPRDIFLKLITSSKFDGIKSKIDTIMSDPDMMGSFLRWSSRIKTEEYALTYVNLIKDKDSLDFIFNTKDELIKLTHYDRDIRYIPNAWCISRRETFDRYLRQYEMYLIRIDINIYGANFYKDTRYTSSFATSVFDYNNKKVIDDEIINKINNAVSNSKLNSDIIVDDFSKKENKIFDRFLNIFKKKR